MREIPERLLYYPRFFLRYTSNDMTISNETMKSFSFLKGMYSDAYFPDICVDKVKEVLVRLCESIEAASPLTLEQLYMLTHASTEEINDLEEFFGEHESELETGAREVMAEDFSAIAQAYGFDADVEELIATREW